MAALAPATKANTLKNARIDAVDECRPVKAATGKPSMWLIMRQRIVRFRAI